MVIAILVNTAGITVYNHFCLEEGESTLSFTKTENCCEDKHPSVNKEVKHACCAKTEKTKSIAEIKKPGCCSQDAFTAQWKLNEFSSQKNILLNSPIISIPVIIPEFKLNLLTSEINSSEISSPPLIIPPADILHLHSILII